MGPTALCPGTFDPVTNGHLDIIERAAQRFDALVVGVLDNPSKQPLFTVEERVSLLKEVTHELADVETLFMTTAPQWSFLSSSLVKEVARFGGDVSALVPPVVTERLRER